MIAIAIAPCANSTATSITITQLSDGTGSWSPHYIGNYCCFVKKAQISDAISNNDFFSTLSCMIGGFAVFNNMCGVCPAFVRFQ